MGKQAKHIHEITMSASWTVFSAVCQGQIYRGSSTISFTHLAAGANFRYCPVCTRICGHFAPSCAVVMNTNGI